MGSGAVKLAHGEAQALADFLRAVARPRNADEADECTRWIRRLEGPRS